MSSTQRSTQHPNTTDIIEGYDIILADNNKKLQVASNLRYEVFTKKFNIKNQKEAKNISQDLRDTHSFTYLIFHKKNQSFIGTVRCCFINDETTSCTLPIEDKIQLKNNIYFQSESLIPSMEISRLCLLPPKGERAGIAYTSLIAFLLLTATRINMFLYPYKYIFALMESSLSRMLNRHNIHFKQFAEPFDYFGEVIPYTIDRATLLRDTEPNMGTITRHYLQQLCKNPEPLWRYIDHSPYLSRSDIRLDAIIEAFKHYGDHPPLEVLAGI